ARDPPLVAIVGRAGPATSRNLYRGGLLAAQPAGQGGRGRAIPAGRPARQSKQLRDFIRIGTAGGRKSSRFGARAKSLGTRLAPLAGARARQERTEPLQPRADHDQSCTVGREGGASGSGNRLSGNGPERFA